MSSGHQKHRVQQDRLYLEGFHIYLVDRQEYLRKRMAGKDIHPSALIQTVGMNIEKEINRRSGAQEMIDSIAD